MTLWAHAIADGHLKNAAAAKADLAKYEALIEQVKKGPRAYLAEGTGPQIETGTVRAWAIYAEGDDGAKALGLMHETADLQDKVGQGEVDIPVREMLADMLLDLKRPNDALVEYDRDLQHSPNRFNGLYNAGMAAEAAGEKKKARHYYTTLQGDRQRHSHHASRNGSREGVSCDQRRNRIGSAAKHLMALEELHFALMFFGCFPRAEGA